SDNLRQCIERLGLFAADGGEREHGGGANGGGGVGAAEVDFHAHRRCGILVFAEDLPAIVVEDDEVVAVQSFSIVVLGAVVDGDAVDGGVAAEIDFPPRIFAVFGSVGLTAVAVDAALVAVDGAAGVAAMGGRGLGCFALAGDIAAFAIDLDFG